LRSPTLPRDLATMEPEMAPEPPVHVDKYHGYDHNTAEPLGSDAPLNGTSSSGNHVPNQSSHTSVSTGSSQARHPDPAGLGTAE